MKEEPTFIHIIVYFSLIAHFSASFIVDISYHWIYFNNSLSVESNKFHSKLTASVAVCVIMDEAWSSALEDQQLTVDHLVSSSLSLLLLWPWIVWIRLQRCGSVEQFNGVFCVCARARVLVLCLSPSVAVECKRHSCILSQAPYEPENVIRLTFINLTRSMFTRAHSQFNFEEIWITIKKSILRLVFFFGK